MDVLRENIGLLQFPQDDYYYEDEDYLNEFSLPWNKKKRTAVQALKANAGRIGARALGGVLGHIAFNKAYKHRYGNIRKSTSDYFANGAAVGLGANTGELLYNKFTGRKLTDRWND